MRKTLAMGMLLFTSGTAWGWGDIGHQTVGEIAERGLTPKGRAFVYRILGAEPFAVSAIWPDIVRSDSRFDRLAPYHYANINEGANYLAVPAEKRAAKDSFTYLTQVPPLLLRDDVPRDRKMILLRYLIHIVGDIHQPLHVTDGTDVGANACDVKWREPVTDRIETANLHSIWDEGLIEIVRERFKREDRRKQAIEAKKAGRAVIYRKRWFGYKEYADRILAQVDRKPQNDDVPETVGAEQFAHWMDETFALNAVAYPKAKVPTPSDRRGRSYCIPKDPKAKYGVKLGPPPMLDEKYLETAIPLVDKQLLKGGRRLAKLLNALAEKAGGSVPADASEAQAELLRSLELKNERPDAAAAEKPAEK